MSSRPRLFQLRCDRVYELARLGDQFTRSELAKVAAKFLRKEMPAIRPGDTIRVHVRIREGDKERLQAFEGVVIGKRNRGMNSSFTVRKISHGEGVERVFQTYSPALGAISVKRRGNVRRAKLYYLRELSGRAARIKEKLG